MIWCLEIGSTNSADLLEVLITFFCDKNIYLVFWENLYLATSETNSVGGSFGSLDMFTELRLWELRSSAVHLWLVLASEGGQLWGKGWTHESLYSGVRASSGTSLGQPGKINGRMEGINYSYKKQSTPTCHQGTAIATFVTPRNSEVPCQTGIPHGFIIFPHLKMTGFAWGWLIWSIQVAAQNGIISFFASLWAVRLCYLLGAYVFLALLQQIFFPSFSLAAS